MMCFFLCESDTLFPMRGQIPSVSRRERSATQTIQFYRSPWHPKSVAHAESTQSVSWYERFWRPCCVLMGFVNALKIQQRLQYYLLYWATLHSSSIAVQLQCSRPHAVLLFSFSQQPHQAWRGSAAVDAVCYYYLYQYENVVLLIDDTAAAAERGWARPLNRMSFLLCAVPSIQQPNQRNSSSR